MADFILEPAANPRSGFVVACAAELLPCAHKRASLRLQVLLPVPKAGEGICPYRLLVWPTSFLNRLKFACEFDKDRVAPDERFLQTIARSEVLSPVRTTTEKPPQQRSTLPRGAFS